MEQVRDRILDAARELFVEHGYEAVSLRKIAQSIDYTAPALYTHFKDKREIMLALCKKDFGALSAAFIKLGAIADPVERIAKIGQTYIRMAVEHPNHYRLMFMMRPPEDVKPDEQDIKAMDDPDQDGYAFLRLSVQQAIDAGAMRPELKDAELIAQVLWSGVHGVASLQITYHDCPWMKWRALDKRIALMTHGLLRGMLADPARLDALAKPKEPKP